MSQPLAFTNATLITGDRDGTVLHDRTVIVGVDGRIATVGPAPIPLVTSEIFSVKLIVSPLFT